MGIFQINFKYSNDDHHEYFGIYITECLYDAIKQLKLEHKFCKNKPVIIKGFRTNLELTDFGFPTNNYRKLIDLIIKDSNLQYLARLNNLSYFRKPRSSFNLNYEVML